MADEDVTLDGKPLQSLRVADLKAALEQRCLPKSGAKSALIKRLKGALMLENLQRTSTPHSGLQPNSQFEEEMSQNSFIKHYLANQQELLRQRLEREAREAAGANVGPACPKEEDNDYTEEGNSSPSNCTDKPAHSMLHLSRSTRSVTVGSPANCLKKDREKDNDEEQEATGLVICTSPGGLQRQDLNSISSELLAQRQPRVLRPLVHKMASEEPDKKRGKRELVSQTGPGEISTSEEPGDKDRRSKNVSMPVKKAILALKNQNKSIRDIAKTFDVSKSTVWYIVKKQECTVDLSNGKRPGRPQKTSVLDDQIMLGIVEDNPFSTVQQIKNTLQDVGIDVSKSTIKRRLSQHKPRGYHNMQTTESPAGPEEEDAEDHMESDSSPSYCPNKATLTQAEEGGGDGGPAVMKQGISGTVSKESSPPPVLSFPLPDTPKHSPHDMDGKSEKAGLAICPPSGGQDSESRSHSSSPEPLRHDQPGPLSLQTHKVASDGAVQKRAEGASNDPTGPGKVSRSEEPDGKRRTKDLSMPVKQAIMRLKNENKSIRDIAKTLSVSKSTVWYIVKKQERTGDLSNGKRPGRPQKTTVLDDQILLGIVEDNPFSTVKQIKNTLQDVGIDVSKNTIRRRLRKHNFERIFPEDSNHC